MSNKLNYILLLALLLQATLSVNAQCAPNVSVLPVNTGYDYYGNTAWTPIVDNNNMAILQDYRWREKTSSTGRKATYIVPEYNYNNVSPFNNSQWISNCINLASSTCNQQTVTYIYEFCLNLSPQNPRCTLKVQASGVINSNDITLNGKVNSATLVPGTTNEYVLNPIDFVAGGINKIEIEVTGNSNYMGLNVQGEVVVDNSTIRNYCYCYPSGLFTGLVFEDFNGDGLKNGDDYGLLGEDIKVEEVTSTGTFIADLGNVQTDGEGRFYFQPLSAGYYRFTYEVNDEPFYRIISSGGTPNGSGGQEYVRQSTETNIVDDIFFGVSRLYVRARIVDLRECTFQGPECGSFNTEFYVVDNQGIQRASSLNLSNLDPPYTHIFNAISYQVNYLYDYSNGPSYIPYNNGPSQIFDEGVLSLGVTTTGSSPDETSLKTALPSLPQGAGAQFVSASTTSDKFSFISFEGEIIDVYDPLLGGLFISESNDYYKKDYNILVNQDIVDQVVCCPNILQFCTEMMQGSENFQFLLDGFAGCDVNGEYCCIDGVEWNFDYPSGPTSTDVNPSFNYPVTGSTETYNCSLKVYVNATCTLNLPPQTVTVYPAANSTLSATEDDCIPQASFTFNAGNYSMSPTTYSWDFGDGNTAGTTSGSTTHTYASGGTYNVTLTVSTTGGGLNSCISFDVSTSVTVNDYSVEILAPSEVCKDEQFAVSLVSTTSPTSQTWTFGDGNSSTVAGPSHTYTTAGSYNIGLTAIFPNCTIPAVTHPIDVIEEAEVRDVSIEGLTRICLGKESFFTLSGELEGATSFNWDFDNGQTATAQSPLVLFDEPGEYTISVTIEFGGSCAEDVTVNMTVIVADYDYCSSCEECIGSFAPSAGNKYVLSAWVRENDLFEKLTYTSPGISFYFEGVNTASPVYKAKGAIIDGWQQIEEVFLIPEGTSAIQIELINEASGTTEDVFFDDIRIYPFNANLKSFVYDPVTMRLKAELDENNYATFYEYDEDGNLIRVKKETERGIKTIQETIKRVKQE